jgi:acyl-CoA dehydrogenase
MVHIAEEYRMLQELAARFTDDELVPLEPRVLARDATGHAAALSDQEERSLFEKCRTLGLWALDVPTELGGANLPAVALMGIYEELGRTATPFHFPPDSPDLHMLQATVNEPQREKYLAPYARGEIRAAIAISEPGAGADPAGMRTRAVRYGTDWIINGGKIWISFVDKADFIILMAVTDSEKKARGGITAFLVDRDNPGLKIVREIPMLGGARTFELLFDNCRLSDEQVLGRVGAGFGPMQLRLTVRRLQMGATCVGIARRALTMMIEHVKLRSTFGAPLADRQTIQWWLSQGATDIHACRLMALDAAAKMDAGEDIRTEASMVKVFGTDMASRIVDQTMQAFGAIGMTKELPLQLMAQRLRLMRIYEGPTEVHHMTIAKQVLRTGV